MKFNYQIRTKDGQVQTGIVDAPSKEAALTLLQRRGFYVTLLENSESQPFYARKIKLFNNVSEKEIVVFSRMLSIMLNSRVPLVESLETLSKQMTNYTFRDKIFKLAEEVEAGSSLSQALSNYPEIFSPFFVSMVRSGETSGKLSESLTYLANHLEREYNLHSKVVGAMVYPIFVLSVFFVVGGMIVFFVMPPLAQILKQNAEQLPAITSITLAIADFLRTYWWIVAIFIIFTPFIVWQYAKSENGKEFFDRFSLKIPLIGSLLKKVYLSRFSENLSSLISGGIPISQALEITGDIIDNSAYKHIIFLARDDVRKGEAISSVLSLYPEYIPPLVSQMVLVGEKTGMLDTSLMNVVRFYQKEVDRSLENMVNILEPLLIVLLGIMIGWLMISVFLPLYNFTGSF